MLTASLLRFKVVVRAYGLNVEKFSDQVCLLWTRLSYENDVSMIIVQEFSAFMIGLLSAFLVIFELPLKCDLLYRES